MYPFFRMALELALSRRARPLPIDGVHMSHHHCMPWDLDIWAELNNGRTLTLYDLGRLPLASRTGLVAAIRRQGWGLTVAGVSVRYRRRVRVFQRLEMRSQFVGADARFLYTHQAMFHRGTPTSSALIRSAVTSPAGIVTIDRVMAALGADQTAQALPRWVEAWAEADSERPWPPEF